MEKIRAVLYGIGAIGSLTANFLLQKEGLEIVGAIDAAKEKVGKNLGDILGRTVHLNVVVSDDIKTVLSEKRPHIVIHTTSSYLKDVYPQLIEIIKHGVNIVSTCEELSYPYYSAQQLAEKLNALAEKHNTTILGTGINPGFLMDTLVITLTAACQKVDKIEVIRSMDASTRRVPFQKKIGAGLSIEEFHDAIRRRLITGHVGLEQSISMVGAALAWKLEEIKTGPVEPVIAKKAVQSTAVEVKPGWVAGLRQTARGYKDGNEAIILDFRAYVGAEEDYDAISIKGIPNINQKITPCIHGDIGTVAMVTNSIPKVINAQPGLITMKDLPLPSAASKNMVNFLK
jgi:hypothetical protein